jgi:conserved hypothetical protein, YceG family
VKRVRIALLTVSGFLLLWTLEFFILPSHCLDSTCELEVDHGLGLRQVANQLVQKNILWEPWTFTWVGRVLGRQGQVKAGSYQWSSPPTPWRLLRSLTEGEENGWEVRISEGGTFAQLRQVLAAQTSLHQDTATLSEARIMARLGIHAGSLEGWFYPDTYVYSPGDSDWDVLRRAHQAMQRHLDSLWRERDPSLMLSSPYQAIIMASLIEKETANSGERSHIAAVFYNRLRLGMRLQTDPTVIYGLGSHYDGHLHRRDLRADTPYNTYTRSGLPPTPIAFPGLAALRAALHPAVTTDLYFVARGDGTHQFSGNLADHERAVTRYQLQRNP